MNFNLWWQTWNLKRYDKVSIFILVVTWKNGERKFFVKIGNPLIWCLAPRKSCLALLLNVFGARICEVLNDFFADHYNILYGEHMYPLTTEFAISLDASWVIVSELSCAERFDIQYILYIRRLILVFLSSHHFAKNA